MGGAAPASLGFSGSGLVDCKTDSDFCDKQAAEPYRLQLSDHQETQLAMESDTDPFLGPESVASQERDDNPKARRGPVPRRAVISALLILLFLVNFAQSLSSLPLNRVIERRLCREYYAGHDKSRIGHDGTVPEEFCKIDEVQRGLAWIQGAVDTAWIVGGKLSAHLAPP